jgi:hypothetical protein
VFVWELTLKREGWLVVAEVQCDRDMEDNNMAVAEVAIEHVHIPVAWGASM